MAALSSQAIKLRFSFQELANTSWAVSDLSVATAPLFTSISDQARRMIDQQLPSLLVSSIGEAATLFTVYALALTWAFAFALRFLSSISDSLVDHGLHSALISIGQARDFPQARGTPVEKCQLVGD
eukprot:gnl/MRDRNA2_/MRDRNA2_85742_c0_seq10.p1 gnl/MRDRNA2_/MRDRNA2_85742_c0~~gnl/MRDRNA2_/MRDRNA2_85742_c0_seq10.p1  ORF type:complete len:126 (+),score=7.98 gnl/MRDRNA2_/MRDRNA2_85742_c0_seq10:206-583(+)